MRPDEIAELLNSSYDLVWFTFASQEKRHSFKNEPPPVMQVMSLLKIPFIMTVHRDDEITNIKNRGWSPWEWQQAGLKNLAGIIVISKQLEGKVKELKLIDDEKVFRTPLCYPDPIRRSDNRKRRITSLSRLATDKRQEKVAELADYLPEDIEVYIHGRTNLFNHDVYQPWIDKGRTVWPGEFYPSDVWNILAETEIGADFDAQEIGDKLQGVTLEFMLSGAVPLVIENTGITGPRWPTLIHEKNCIKIWEDELTSEVGLKRAGNRVSGFFENPDMLEEIRQNNYKFVEQFRPPAVRPILEEVLLKVANGYK
jgi:glycosyltransferase involved in cell wall biosynthesis